jgi:FlaA1/EpsC-like NDP-sugar epimerase
LINLSGLEVGRDIDIVFTGLRPGEKLFEELFVDGENSHRTAHQKIFVANDASALMPDNLDQAVDELIAVATRGDEAAIRLWLQRLIPGFDQSNAGAPAEPAPLSWPAVVHQTTQPPLASYACAAAPQASAG